MSSIETLKVAAEILSLIGSTFFRFARTTIHDFQNTQLNSSTNATKNGLMRVNF